MKLLKLVCIGVLGTAGFVPMAYAQKGGGAKKPTPVITTTVIKSEFADYIEALATTKSNESVVVTADESEKVTAVHFEDGQIVKKGDLLVTLDKTQEEAELRAAMALTAERRNAYNRAKGLSGNSALPKATLQTRLAELKQSQADTEAIKARLKNYEVRAPFDGVLGLREISVGTLVQPGDMITTIDDLSQIKVDFSVPSVFLTALKPNLPIVGYVEAFGDREFKGVIKTINTQIDPVTRTVRVRAILPNDDGVLKPGLLMSITLSKNQRQSLLIPEEALVKRSDKNFVFSVNEKDGALIAQQKEIQLGSRQPGVVEVLSGLDEGERIVSHGVSKIRNGSAVMIRAEENVDAPLKKLLEQNAQTSSNAGE